MRIVHYLNQFFGGVGGEEKAGMGLEVREGATGPGKLFEQIMGDDAKVAVTLVCGDNYAVENLAAMSAAALEQIRNAKADLFIGGPCFQAGRYGMAAGALGSAVQAKLKIPVVTAMSEENPGADLYRKMLYIIDSGTNAAKMRNVLVKMANLARKLVSKAEIGLPKEEGKPIRSEEHTSELQSSENLVCRLLLGKKSVICRKRIVNSGSVTS